MQNMNHILKIVQKNLYECQYCGLFMKQNELKDHEYICGSKTIKCEYCGENVTKTTYDLHLEYTCEKFKKIMIKIKKMIKIILMKILIKLLIKIKKKKM